MIAIRSEIEKARSYYVSPAFGIIFLILHCLPTLTVKVRCTKRSGRLEIKEKNHLHAEWLHAITCMLSGLGELQLKYALRHSSVQCLSVNKFLQTFKRQNNVNMLVNFKFLITIIPSSKICERDLESFCSQFALTFLIIYYPRSKNILFLFT